jgi:hypothetical protein
MHSGLNLGEGIRFGALGFRENIVVGRTREVDGLPDDTPLQGSRRWLRQSDIDRGDLVWSLVELGSSASYRRTCNVVPDTALQGAGSAGNGCVDKMWP